MKYSIINNEWKIIMSLIKHDNNISVNSANNNIYVESLYILYINNVTFIVAGVNKQIYRILISIYNIFQAIFTNIVNICVISTYERLTTISFLQIKMTVPIIALKYFMGAAIITAAVAGVTETAKASEGRINIGYAIGTEYVNNNCEVVHYSEGLEGYGINDDHNYYPMFNFSGVTSFVTSSVDGHNLDVDVRPENSTSSASLSYGILVRGGGAEPNLVSPFPYLVVNVSGFDGENVFIDGVDARTISTIPLSSTFGSLTITFSPVTPQVTDPTVNTLSAADIGTNSATFWAEFPDDGNDAASELCRGRFGYYLVGNEENLMYTDYINNIQEGTNFSSSISGLDPNSMHGYWAEVENLEGLSGLGGLEYFVTQAIPVEPIIKDVLSIKNFINQFADPNDPNKPKDANTGQGIFNYIQRAGAFATLDPYDVLHRILPGISKSPKVVSLKPYKNSKGEIIGFDELSTDATPLIIDPNDPNSSTLLETSIFVVDSNLVVISPSELIISLPHYDVNNLNVAFNGKPLTIQRVVSDSNVYLIDPNFAHPVWDLRQIILENNGRLPLEYLMTINADPNTRSIDANIPVKIIKPNVGYGFFDLSTIKEVMDINGSGGVTRGDYDTLLKMVGKTISRGDIASIKNNKIVLGIPDGIVNAYDERAFIKRYNETHADKIPDPYNIPGVENFESGDFSRFPWNNHGSTLWGVVLDKDEAHSGLYCAESAIKTAGGSSTLEVTFNSVKGGDLIFDVDLVSDYQYGALTASVDGVEKKVWNGNNSWNNNKIYVAPGVHTFKIRHKENTIKTGERARIDNIVFPVDPNSGGYIGASTKKLIKDHLQQDNLTNF
jgi:hypothetical protein